MSEGETAAASEKIGSALRAAREAANASLDDISALLKIRSDHLQALENDDFGRLPGSVYAIGFIRTYATHLGLNAGELIERYKAAVAVPHLEDQGPDPQTEYEPVSGPLKIAIGVAAVFVVYILWLIAGGAGDDEKNSRLAETAEPVREAPVAPAPRRASRSSTSRRAAPRGGRMGGYSSVGRSTTCDGEGSGWDAEERSMGVYHELVAPTQNRQVRPAARARWPTVRFSALREPIPPSILCIVESTP